MQLPFAPGTFDFVSSDQVIHHTPDARRAFADLAALLAPGGVFAVYVYRVKAPLRELADDWIRERATVMEPERGDGPRPRPRRARPRAVSASAAR